ncbi:MAG: tyrosine-type recombinase/integrase [Bacteroidales bacterium]|nr:tyrosine-type recombinase/integrase [Bacteroidales bacterium]
MSAKHSFTTADYIPWEQAMNLIRKLYKDGKYRESLLIGCGCFFGLRISDLLTLTWNDLLSNDSFMLIEKKTSKRRIVKINKGFQAHVKDCHDAMKIKNDSQPCFLNRYGSVISIQAINKLFKQIKVDYMLKVTNFSTHSLRKTFGRRVVEQAGSESEMALIKLSEIFNHSTPMITRRYLGLRQQELVEVYDSLMF